MLNDLAKAMKALDGKKERAANGPVHSPVSGPIKTKQPQNTNKTKTNQTTQKTHKQKPRKRWDSSQLLVIMCKMTSCVPSLAWPLIQSNKSRKREQKGPYRRVREATRHAETQDPPSQDPRDHKAQPSGITSHQGTSKQTPTTPGRNESGETKMVKQQVRCWPVGGAELCAVSESRHRSVMSSRSLEFFFARHLCQR